ncbi:DUF2306 domain-containing protein [Lysobacter sp. D1-1-M9]|uniref:DUF2306 domain-containing protein n=1 Tax=Novilysobacter longmucuonensis TaxID=3098603 RepID=UPI002FC8337D
MRDETYDAAGAVIVPAAPQEAAAEIARRFPRMQAVLPAAALVVGSYYVAMWAARYLTLDAAVYGSRWSLAPLVFLHVLFGIIALMVGPFQFWSGLRRYNLTVHRWVGRTYVASVAASVLCAVALLILRDHSINFRLGIGGLSLAWAGTTSLALVAIRRRLIAQHREWMIRSYVVTFGFVLFRIILDVMGAYEVGTLQERIAVASWACWAVPLLITELILQGRHVIAGRARLPLPG